MNKNILIALFTSALLVACNSGNSPTTIGSTQTNTSNTSDNKEVLSKNFEITSRADKYTNDPKKCFADCIKFTVNLENNSNTWWWNPGTGAEISITNNCKTSQDISGKAFFLGSKSIAGDAITLDKMASAPIGSEIKFYPFAHDRSLHVGSISGNTSLAPGQTLKFKTSVGVGLKGCAFDVNHARETLRPDCTVPEINNPDTLKPSGGGLEVITEGNNNKIALTNECIKLGGKVIIDTNGDNNITSLKCKVGSETIKIFIRGNGNQTEIIP